MRSFSKLLLQRDELYFDGKTTITMLKEKNASFQLPSAAEVAHAMEVADAAASAAQSAAPLR